MMMMMMMMMMMIILIIIVNTFRAPHIEMSTMRLIMAIYNKMDNDIKLNNCCSRYW